MKVYCIFKMYKQVKHIYLFPLYQHSLNKILENYLFDKMMSPQIQISKDLSIFIIYFFQYFESCLRSNVYFHFVFCQMEKNTSMHFHHFNNSSQFAPFSSLYSNPRLQVTIDQLSKTQRLNKNRSLHRTNKSVFQADVQKKQSFRSFAKSRRSFKPCKQRQFYINLKQEMEDLIIFLDSNAINFELSHFLQTKQKIMVGFLDEFIAEISTQNLDKAQLLVLIFNNLFLMAQRSMQKFCIAAHFNQQFNLKEQITMHQKYQKILSQNLREKQKMKEENQKKEKFMKILVAKLRQYKKSMKKMEQTLRIAADKLNQFRNGFLEVQIQCINLTMQLKNIGQQSAKDMVNKKMALVMERSKQYKILPSKKKMRKQLKEVRSQCLNEENNFLKQEFYESFKSNLNEKPQALAKILGNVIESILDKQESEAINYSIFNQNLIQKYQEQSKVDKQTDMQGFEIDKADKKVGINPQQRFYQEMTKIRSVQTQAAQKPEQIRVQSRDTQCDIKMLKISRLQIKKTLDQSFLFENSVKNYIIKRQQSIFRAHQMKQLVVPAFLPDKQKRKKVIQKVDKSPQQAEQSVEAILTQMIDKQKQKIYEETSKKKIVTLMVDNDQQKSESQQQAKHPDNKRRIKKLASTIFNKSSFLQMANYIHGQLSSHLQPSTNAQSKLQQGTSKGLQIVNENAGSEYQEINYEDCISIDEVEEKNHKRNKIQDKQRNNKKTKTEEINVDQWRKNYKKGEVSKKLPLHIRDSSKQRQSEGRIKQKYSSLHKNKSMANLSGFSSSKKHQSNLYYISGQTKKQIQVNTRQIFEDFTKQIDKVKHSGQDFLKKPNKIREISRYLQSVYQQACRGYQNFSTSKNLILYLYETLNTQQGLHSHKKIVVFLKQCFLLKDSSFFIKLFLSMLGIWENGNLNYQYCTENNNLLIRLAKKLSLNWKHPLRFSQLTINQDSFQEKLSEELIQSGFCQTFIFQLSNILQQLGLLKNSSANKPKQMVPFLLAVSQFIDKKQRTILTSYEPMFQLFNQDEYISIQFMRFLVEISFSTRKQILKGHSKLELFMQKIENKEQITKNEFAFFCSQLGFLDFSRLFYRTIGKLRLKQNSMIFKQIKIEKLKKMKMRNVPTRLLNVLYENCENLDQKNAFFHAMIKKNLLVLLFLKAVEYQSQRILSQILGEDIEFLFQSVMKF